MTTKRLKQTRQLLMLVQYNNDADLLLVQLRRNDLVENNKEVDKEKKWLTSRSYSLQRSAVVHKDNVKFTTRK